MTPEEIIISLALTIPLCLICGWVYAFAAGDTKPRKRKTVAVALASGAVGWGFGMLLPIHEFKGVGAIFVALMAAVYGSHIYWFIFKPKSKITKIIDANGHVSNHRRDAFNSI
jgi:hypothetical protein